MTKSIRRSNCPISLSLDIFGDKWTLLILRDFIFFDNRHFNQLVTIEKISTNILADRLARLVEHSVIKKEVDETNKSSYKYSLTPKGLELVPIVLHIYQWGAKHTKGNNAEPAFRNKINSDYRKTTHEIIADLKQKHNIQ